MKLKLSKLRQYLGSEMCTHLCRSDVCEYVISNIYWNFANVAQLYKDNDDGNDEMLMV